MCGAQRCLPYKLLLLIPFLCILPYARSIGYLRALGAGTTNDAVLHCMRSSTIRLLFRPNWKVARHFMHQMKLPSAYLKKIKFYSVGSRRKSCFWDDEMRFGLLQLSNGRTKLPNSFLKVYSLPSLKLQFARKADYVTCVQRNASKAKFKVLKRARNYHYALKHRNKEGYESLTHARKAKMKEKLFKENLECIDLYFHHLTDEQMERMRNDEKEAFEGRWNPSEMGSL